jgi:predicted NAD/FAD-binding protein
MSRLAIIGSGVAGLGAAWSLSRAHEVVVYEADDRLGGHAHTVQIDDPSGPVTVDTGFIVYNERNYPNLVALFDHPASPPSRATCRSRCRSRAARSSTRRARWV